MDCVRIAEDGAWCWFGDPRAVYHDGKVFTGWVSRDGGIRVASYDVARRLVQRTNLHPKLEADDHNNPSLLVRPDGRILVAWSRHARDDMYLAVSKRPGEVYEFEPPRRILLNSREANRHCYSGGQDSYTYPSLFHLSLERRLDLGWRGLDFKPNLSWSDDYGRTWAPGRIYIVPEKTYLNQRPYIKIASNGADTLHFAFTDGHPRNEPENSVYYARLTRGEFQRADGSPISKLQDVPFDGRRADVVYDARRTKEKAWIWDVAADSAGRPVIVYVRFPSDTDHRYHYAHEIARGGGWFPQTPAGKVEREPNYSGGLVLDHGDPDTVHLSIPVQGVREIERWKTSDLGVSWSKSPVTTKSKRDNIRPFTIRNAPAGGPRVLWMSLRRYTHYTDFDAGIFTDR